MAYKVTVASTRGPVTNSEAKEFLRLDEDIDDLQVNSLVIAATEWAENYTGRALINRTVEQHISVGKVSSSSYSSGFSVGHQSMLNDYSSPDCLELAVSPVSSFTDIKYYDDSDQETTWSSSNYYVDLISDVPKVHMRETGIFPTNLRRANSMKLTYVAGYGNTTFSVPEPIRIAILNYMTFLYEHRGEFERFPPPVPAKQLTQLLTPYRIMRFSSTPYNVGNRVGMYA